MVFSLASGVAFCTADFVALLTNIIVERDSDKIRILFVPEGGLFAVFGITLRYQAHPVFFEENIIC